MKELVVSMAQGLVDYPDQMEVTETRDKGIVDLVLKVVPDDMGKAIGKRGSIANSMRQILKACAIKENVKVNLEIRAIDE